MAAAEVCEALIGGGVAWLKLQVSFLVQKGRAPGKTRSLSTASTLQWAAHRAADAADARPHPSLPCTRVPLSPLRAFHARTNSKQASRYLRCCRDFAASLSQRAFTCKSKSKAQWQQD